MPKDQQGLRVIQHLGQTYRAMMAAFDAQVGHALPRWRILLALHENGTSSQKFLAERCMLDPASLTRQLQAMEALEWVSRQTDTQDNRLTNVMLTPRGKGVVAAALPRRAEFFDHALKGLNGAQIDALGEILRVLEGNFKASLQQAARQDRAA
jgi:DNA-binding MarR family transcriptional regulator